MRFPPAITAFVSDLEKTARVSGAAAPRVSDAEVPYSTRKRLLLEYAKQKAREAKTPWGTAMGTGAVVGTGIGALGGALGGSMLPGAAVGAVGGTLIGALMKASDDAAIADAKRLGHPGADVEAEVARQIVMQKRRAESDRNWREERRHSELLGALGSRRGYSRYY